MYLSWNIYVRPDGSCRVPPGSADGEIAEADQVYPSVGEAWNDLYDAVITDYLNSRADVRVNLVLREEVAS